MRVLYRDEWVMAVDKAAGVLTVPGRGAEEGEALSAQVRAVAPGALPVHRLDRDTSGVVLFGLTREAHRALNAAFESRRAEKTYLALVRGDLGSPVRCELPLFEGRRGTMRVAGRGDARGQAARTDFTPVERFGAATWCSDRKSTRLNSSHSQISYAVFCLKKKKKKKKDSVIKKKKKKKKKNKKKITRK